MPRFLASDEDHPDLIHDDDYRSYLFNRADSPARGFAERMEKLFGSARAASVVLFSFFRSVVGSVMTFLGPSWDGPDRKYRPEDHYMRGPGPKWREKHLPGRASSASRM